MKKYVLLLIGLLICGLFLLPRLNWDGSLVAEVQVRVIDAVNGAPIPSAGVEVLNYNGQALRLPVPTNMAGIGTVGVMVGAGGGRSLLYQSMQYGADAELIRVNAPGYTPKMAAPGYGKGMRVFGFGHTPRLAVTVSLSRAPTTANQPKN